MNILKEPLYQILMDSVSDIVFVMKVTNNEEFIYAYANFAAIKGMNFKNNRIVGKPIHEVISHEKATFLCQQYRKVVQIKTSITYKDKYVSKQGEVRYAKTKLIPLMNHQQKCTYIIAIVKDITDKVKMTNQLAKTEENFRIIAENAYDLITLINNTGENIYTSPSYKDILGIDPQEYIGKFFLHNVHSKDRVGVNKKITQAIKNRENFTVEFRQFNSKHKPIWSEANGTPVFDEQNKFKHMVVVTRDIRQQKRYESKLKYFAMHDSLTGLPNRRQFNKHLKHAIKKFKEREDKLAVIMLDIDKFKNTNDEMGHDIGEAVIEEYGHRVKNAIGEKDIVARLGGDEFIVLLSNITTVDQVISIAESIQRAIRKPWNINGNSLKVTTSMGISIISSKNTTPFTIFKHADIALYDAKAAGGNTYKINGTLKHKHKSNTPFT